MASRSKNVFTVSVKLVFLSSLCSMDKNTHTYTRIQWADLHSGCSPLAKPTIFIVQHISYNPLSSWQLSNSSSSLWEKLFFVFFQFLSHPLHISPPDGFSFFFLVSLCSSNYIFHHLIFSFSGNFYLSLITTVGLNGKSEWALAPHYGFDHDDDSDMDNSK